MLKDILNKINSVEISGVRLKYEIYLWLWKASMKVWASEGLSTKRSRVLVSCYPRIFLDELRKTVIGTSQITSPSTVVSFLKQTTKLIDYNYLMTLFQL